jgi:ribonuclease P protein component
VAIDASAPVRIERMKKRADFLRAQKYRRQHAPGLTLETCPSPPEVTGTVCRVGFTASRKIGSAVARNRAKRRLRAVAAQILPLLGRGGHDYVLVAKAATLSRPYSALVGDLTKALKGAHATLEAKAGDDRKGSEAHSGSED